MTNDLKEKVISTCKVKIEYTTQRKKLRNVMVSHLVELLNFYREEMSEFETMISACEEELKYLRERELDDIRKASQQMDEEEHPPF